MTRFRPTRIGKPLTFLLFSVVGLLLAQFASAALPNAPRAGKAAGPTRKIVGYAVDPTGRPIADALVLLTRADDLSLSPPEPSVIAQSNTQLTGRFELSVSAADLKTPAVGWPVFAIWVHKAGFAVAHSTVSPEHGERSYLISLESDSPFIFRVETPDGLPCTTAIATSTTTEFVDDWYNRVPKPIQERLKTQTTAIGRCEVPGLNNRRCTVEIETPEFGKQRLFVSGRRPPFATVRLRPTHKVEGRLILPSGANADLTRVGIGLKIREDQMRSSSAALGKGLWWYDCLIVQPDSDGCYEVAHVPEGVEALEIWPTWDLPFVEDARQRVPVSATNASPGTSHNPHGRKRQIRFSFSWDSSLPETLFELACSVLSREAVCEQDMWLRRGVRITRIVRDAATKRPLPAVYVRVASVPRNPEFKASLAKVRTLVPLVGLPLAVALAAGDFARAESMAIVNPWIQDYDDMYSDEYGRIKCGLYPGQTYATTCHIPDHYFPAPSNRLIDEIPVGVAECELPPIELVPEYRLAGQCKDATGRPAAGVRIRATVAAGASSGNQTETAPRWSQSDASGDFHFDGLEPGTRLTLASIHAGVPLEERTVVVGDQALGGVHESKSGPWKVTHVLREKHQELTSLAGRVVGLDHRPIPGADVVVEIEHSPDPTHFFRTTVDGTGRVQTPRQYPKGLKYRLAVRSLLRSVAVSPWICPRTNGSVFADVVVDPARLGLDRRIDGGEVVALVDGRPILASEIFERAYPEPLGPDGLSLLVAAKGLESGRVTEAEYRAVQLLAIKKYAAGYVRTRMPAQALDAALGPAEKADIDRRIDSMFEEYVEKLKRDVKVVGRDQLEEKLRGQGTSLATLKREFRYRLLADEYIRRAVEAAESRLDGQRSLAYYESHLASYAMPAKVSWQMLEFEFERGSGHQPGNDPTTQTKCEASTSLASGASSPTADESGKNNKESDFDFARYIERPSNPLYSRAEARHLCEAALGELHRGIPFERVVKHFTTGAKSDEGGWQPRLKPESVADPKTAEALRELPEGSTSGIIETESAYRIVKVACRMPTAWRPFEEVAPTIRQQIRQEAVHKCVEELYSRTAIESPYLDEFVLGQPATSPPKSQPADAFSE